MENNNPLDKIREKGWASMSKILDHEMPRKKERKRMLVFFLPLGVSGLFILGILLYNNSPTSVSNKVTTISKFTPLINKKNTTPQPQAEVLINNDRIGLMYKDETFGKESQKEAISTYKNNDGSESKELFPNEHLSWPGNVLVDLSASSDQNIGHVTEKTDVELLNTEVRDTITILEMLPVFIHSIYYTKKLHNRDLPIKYFNTSIHFGILSSLSSANFKEISNYYFGFHTYKKISSKWAIVGQLGLRTYAKSNFYIQNKSGDNNTEIDFTNAFLVENKSLTKDELNLFNTALLNEITNKVYYLECQFGTKFTVSKHIELIGGLSVSRFLKEKFSINNDARVLYASINQTSLPTMDANELSNNKIESLGPLHKKWLFGLNIGAETDILDNVKLFSNFNYNITKQAASLQNLPKLSSSPYTMGIQNSNVDGDKRYNIELGVKYYFK